MATEDGSPFSTTEATEKLDQIGDLVNRVQDEVERIIKMRPQLEIAIGEKAIKFCLQCLRAGLTADEILKAWREGKGL